MSKGPYAQQAGARREHAGKLLQDLWYNAPLSMAMLAERNDLTKATVSAICAKLAALGLIRRVGLHRTGPGRPGTLLELDPQGRSAIGVEISTNYVAVVLTDLWGQALWQHAVWLSEGSDQEAVLTQSDVLIAEAIDQTRERATLGPLLGIGLAVPGGVAPPSIVYATHLKDACTLGAAALILDAFFAQTARR